MTLLASSIAAKKHLVAFDKMLEERFASLDLLPLMVYLIDTVHPSALIHLAEQFDVMGNKGWNMCDTGDQRRALIKKAIELHRYAGTPWAVKEALRSVGFYDVEIIEHVGNQYDGTIRHNSTNKYGGDSWANFKVILNIGDTRGVSAAQAAQVHDLIDVYKSWRSRLVAVGYKSTFTDTLTATDEISGTIYGSTEIDKLSEVNQYDGIVTYSGAIKHYSTSDVSSAEFQPVPGSESLSMADDPGVMTIYNRDTGLTTTV